MCNNIGNDQPIAIKELAQKVKQAAQSNSEIKYISFQEAFKGKAVDFEEINCRIPNISKIKNLLGYQPKHDIDSIIRNTMEYFREKSKKR